VEITALSLEEHTGNIVKLLPRKNTLLRPAVANVDQALLVFALSSPQPNLNLLDRFLVSMDYQEIPVLLCFNKADDTYDFDLLQAIDAYEKKAGYSVLITSTQTGQGIDEIRKLIRKKTTVLAGPSGVGKSSMLNLLVPKANMDTGEVSAKIGRGRHTTRHSEVFFVEEDTYILDTPGFSSLYVEGMEADTLQYCFPEFAPYIGTCRFNGCVHMQEPACAVKDAVSQSLIAESRYENYKLFYEEVKQKKKY
jgi:ribosome biogenesis GTPase